MAIMALEIESGGFLCAITAIDPLVNFAPL